MRIQTILFEPNAHYLASGRLNLGRGSMVYNDSIDIETDAQGKVIDIRDGHRIDGIGDIGDAWDILTLTHKTSNKIIDCRLHTAAVTGETGLAEMAFREDANVNLRMKQGATPLHWASAHNQLALVELLVDNGADLDSCDDLGWTPITLAASQGHNDIVKFLAEKGAKRSAIVNGEEVFIDDNKANKEDLNWILLDAAESGNLEGVKASVEAGADLNSTTPDGWTALLECANSDFRITEFLLSKGADPNLASGKGLTPLMRAAAHGQAEIVKMLLKSGADPTMRDFQGINAAGMASIANQMECAKLVCVIPEGVQEKNGANVILLSDAVLAVLSMARDTVGGTVRYVQITFDDGKKFRCECIDELQAIVPAEYNAENIDKVEVPLDQSSPADIPAKKRRWWQF
ncbi:MAG: ankyrin repeat domain-containing protein [Candidatus Thiodiazotropha sp.]